MTVIKNKDANLNQNEFCKQCLSQASKVKQKKKAEHKKFLFSQISKALVVKTFCLITCTRNNGGCGAVVSDVVMLLLMLLMLVLLLLLLLWKQKHFPLEQK